MKRLIMMVLAIAVLALQVLAAAPEGWTDKEWAAYQEIAQKAAAKRAGVVAKAPARAGKAEVVNQSSDLSLEEIGEIYSWVGKSPSAMIILKDIVESGRAINSRDRDDMKRAAQIDATKAAYEKASLLNTN